MGTDYFVRYVSLPMSVKAVTLPNDDCTFDIYINDSISEVAQKRALDHELQHIAKNHFYDDCTPVSDQEREREAG